MFSFYWRTVNSISIQSSVVSINIPIMALINDYAVQYDVIWHFPIINSVCIGTMYMYTPVESDWLWAVERCTIFYDFRFSVYTEFTLHYLLTCISTKRCDRIACKHKVIKRTQYCLAVRPGCIINHICQMLLIFSTLILWCARSLIGDLGCQESSLLTCILLAHLLV